MEIREQCALLVTNLGGCGGGCNLSEFGNMGQGWDMDGIGIG